MDFDHHVFNHQLHRQTDEFYTSTGRQGNYTQHKPSFMILWYALAHVLTIIHSLIHWIIVRRGLVRTKGSWLIYLGHSGQAKPQHLEWEGCGML